MVLSRLRKIIFLGFILGFTVCYYLPYFKKTKPIGRLTVCRKKINDIAFLKVHKCGSTTVSNIIQRFGMRNDLNFVLPDKPHEGQFWVLGSLDNFDWQSIIPLPKGRVYNILSVDTIYDNIIYRKLIPNNPFILGIVRDPVERYISMDFYEGRGIPLVEKYKGDPYIYAHIKGESETDEVSAIRGMAYDFGLPVVQRNVEASIRSLVERIDVEFHFVMVMEYFDESLVLLKRKLCWKTRDVLYIKRNQNPQKKQYALSPEHRQNLRNIQKADVNIYEHFKRKLFKEITSLGTDELDEIHNFKNLLRIIGDFCAVKKPFKLTITATAWNEAFDIDQSECALMLLNEFELVKKLQDRQRQIFQGNKS
ncbi:galactose-3-O-sulfotransferase 2-like [Patella vulgata]|uniref:galactose-3-O-sulfotransferase 2-like n=1 Tax=Patella vulgata TaxID=6465 RepID=UPI0024A98466|nr:galactose-3-O-sulfotransferase 2-like [Patella vulgata]XP_055955696.1 galactose-3-O-sulfotransferase 2-like [Patella vulgata]